MMTFQELIADAIAVNPFIIILGFVVVSIFFILAVKPDGRFTKWLRRNRWIE